jgi:hypothetical protein
MSSHLLRVKHENISPSQLRERNQIVGPRDLFALCDIQECFCDACCKDSIGCLDTAISQPYRAPLNRFSNMPADLLKVSQDVAKPQGVKLSVHSSAQSG